MKSNMWGVFKMDRKKEIEGVTFQYPGGIRITLARAGGGNAAFSKAHEIRMRPHRAAARVPGGLSEDLQRDIIADVYLDSVIKRFETNVSDDPQAPDWQPVIVMEDGSVVDATRENLKLVLLKLPDLLQQIITDSQSMNDFRKDELEAEAGN